MTCAVPLLSQSLLVEGVVRDASGAPVAGAAVSLKTAASSAKSTTDANGGFRFDNVAENRGTVAVSAAGFAPASRDWEAADGQAVRLEIVLAIATRQERMVVTATRIGTRLADVAGSAVALDSEDLGSIPALTVDDKLRQIPGFTLFRRSGSRTANPTSLGVSLSGVGASGASRALVLEDGVPLNDPFGSWIYWDRIPQQALAGVEVVRRGESSLYGGDALSGVIQFLTRQPEGPDAALEISYGSEDTPDLSLWTGTRIGPWDLSLATELFRTDGYILVPASIRGSVDTRANLEDAVLDFTLGHRLGGQGRIFGRGSYFTESRNNGTPIQTNDTQIGSGVVGVDTPLGSSGSLSARLYGSGQSYDQNFSAIAANRMSEALTDAQHVPAQQLGGSVFWSQARGRRQTLGLGAGADEVIGSSHENLFSSGRHTAMQISGGRQRTVAVYGEDVIHISAKWTATASFRFDDWRNFDAQSVRTPLAPPGPPVVTPFADRTDTAFSPRVSLLYAVGKGVSLTASAYRSFRSPTLNELYRGFRMGNVLTEANSNLNAERLTGGEAGARVRALSDRLTLRGNFFWIEVGDPIENVTLTTTPTLITRQRENLGRTRSLGMELDGVVRVAKWTEIFGGYQYVAATVVSDPASAALVGRDLPQTPRNQFTLQARYWQPSGFQLSVEGRFVGQQFDDDQNQFLLPRFFALDLLVGHSLGHGVEAFAAFENLFDQRYTVALTPTPMLGPPILARIGLRYRRLRANEPR
jgi:outer membrane receptor protein involved in Fe transport